MSDKPPSDTTPRDPFGLETPTDYLGHEPRSGGARDTPSSSSGHVPMPLRIGSYRVLELLGEGGMGTVYLAEQTHPIQRQVAIKVIRGHHAGKDALRRFELERHALARMSHPYIAQVYEAGQSANGDPYIVMEHIPGLPIVRYCDEQRLGIEQRLDLFALVCEGVQHAHRKGLIHRDLKPGNILVREEQGKAIPTIIDFGIAKVLDQDHGDATLLTGDRIVGTPAYLSPEAILSSQWGLDLDTRSDVYSLGVILYELLVGTVPFGLGNESFLGSLRRITEVDSPPAATTFSRLDVAEQQQFAASRQLTPAALSRQLRGDLTWIVAKAIARDRDRRYDSAAALAEDLRRYRQHQPVQAGPPGLGYQTRKLIRRHTAASIGAVLFALAIIGGFVARTLEAERANREAQRANREAAELRRTSEEATELARFLVGLFDIPAEAVGGARSLTAPELLERGTQRLRADLDGQPLAQARLLETIGIVYRKLGLYEDAESLLEEALATRERELGPRHLDTAASLANVVTLYQLTGRFAEAEPLAERALAVREAELGPDHVDVAQSVEALALLYRRLGKLELAEPLLLRAIPSIERQLGPNHPELANALNALGIHYWNRGRFEQAAGHLQRALDLWERVRGSNHPEVAATLNNLAGVKRDQGRFEDAEPLYQRSLAIRLSALGPEHPAVGYSYANIAQLRRKEGRLDEAEALYRQALELWQRALGGQHPEVAYALNNLALTLAQLGRATEAEVLCQRALAINLAALGPDHPSVASTFNIQATVARELGRIDEAESLHQRALELYEKSREPGHPSIAWPLQDLANLYRDHGRHTEAGPLYLRALEIRRTALGPQHPETLELEADFAAWQAGQGS